MSSARSLRWWCLHEIRRTLKGYLALRRLAGVAKTVYQGESRGETGESLTKSTLFPNVPAMSFNLLGCRVSADVRPTPKNEA